MSTNCLPDPEGGPMAHHMLFALILMSLMSPAAEGVAGLRGVRMDLPSLFEEATPRQIVENVASVHLNAILCTVHTPVLEDGRFQEMLEAAHARGILVHVVLSTIVAGAIAPRPPVPDPGANATDSSGKLAADWLCPAKPGVRQQVLKFARRLAALDIDGLQLDYIRFGPPDLCYCGLCRRDSEAWLKVHPGLAREDWRDSVITSLVVETRQAVKSIRPAIVFSCSTWTAGEGQHRTSLTPEGEGFGWQQGQNFTQLRDEVDFLRPMLYSCMLCRNPEWIVEMTRLAVRNAGGKTAIIPGVALTIEEPWKACSLAPGELTKVIPAILRAGAAGVAIFSYQSLFSPRYSHLGYADEVRRLFGKP
jgi:uncharacterized lipoprotein YddW (UPF0748 family)